MRSSYRENARQRSRGGGAEHGHADWRTNIPVQKGKVAKAHRTALRAAAPLLTPPAAQSGAEVPEPAGSSELFRSAE